MPPDRPCRRKTLRLRPVGVVRAPFRTLSEVPPWGGPAEIVIAPDYAAALAGIERSSHLFVVGYLHTADRTTLVARPRRLAPGAPPVGVFGCRTPDRPNPLGLTVCRLVARSESTLHVDPLDFVDGTPIVDLKPYNPGWDDVFSARRERRVNPAARSDDELRAWLDLALTLHLGADAGTPEAQLAGAAVLRAVRHFDLDPRDARLGVALNRADRTTDALQGLIGATFGAGRLLVRPAPDEPLRVAFFAGARVLALAAGASAAAEPPPATLVAEVFEELPDARAFAWAWLAA